MPYSRRRTTRSGTRRMSANTRGRKSSGVRARRRAGRRSSAGGTRTVRLVIEQAAPTVQPVVGQSGAYAVPDTSTPRRSKF